MKGQEKWSGLVTRLLSICVVFDRDLSASSEVPHRICRALFLKAVETVRGIQLLYEASLPVQAQVLIRVLLELRIDLGVFLRMTAESPVDAALRVIDAMMLEKVKQQRASNFNGLELIEGAPKRDDFLKLEEKIAARRGKREADRMRKYGFSGESVESRAQDLGLTDLYHVVYRNFSRNVHAADYTEHLRANGMSPPSQWQDYEDSRDHVALSTAITCLWEMALLLSETLKCGSYDELNSFWTKCTNFEHWVPVPTGRVDVQQGK